MTSPLLLGGIATNQPLDSDLSAIAALVTTEAGRSLLDDATVAAMRSTLSVHSIAEDDAAYVALAASPAPIRKTADETVNDSSTLQNDDVLLFAIAANEIWSATFELFVTGNATADIKFAIAVPAGATVVAASHGARAADTVMEASASMVHGADASVRLVSIVALITNAGTAGSVTLQWAQSAATVGNTTVKAGSFVLPRRVG